MWSGYRVDPKWQQVEQAFASSEGKIIECHASGHAHGADLFSFIDRLNPRKIIPVHTRSAAEFQNRYGEKCGNGL